MKFVLAVLILVAGCSTQQLDETQDVLDIVSDVADIDAALHEPSPKDYKAHWEWCKEHRDHEHCK